MNLDQNLDGNNEDPADIIKKRKKSKKDKKLKKSKTGDQTE